MNNIPSLIAFRFLLINPRWLLINKKFYKIFKNKELIVKYNWNRNPNLFCEIIEKNLYNELMLFCNISHDYNYGLYGAYKNGDSKIIELMLKKSNNFNWILERAAEDDKFDIVKLMIEKLC